MASPLMLPGISTESVRSVGGYNYKGNGRVDLPEREREQRKQGVNELKNTIERTLLLQIPYMPY